MGSGVLTMKSRYYTKVGGAILVAAFVTACASSSSSPGMAMGPEAQDPAALWSRMCVHCHALRPAPEFTGAQWSIIVQHMRAHGDLTRSQAMAITEYLRRVTDRGDA